MEGKDIHFIAPVLKVIESQATTGYTIYTYQKILIRQILKVLGNLYDEINNFLNVQHKKTYQ